MVAVKRASFVLVLALAAVVVLAAGCAKNALKQEHDALRAQLAEVETMGGKVCAPREFASAEAQLDYADEEWAEREYQSARTLLDGARKNVVAARQLSGHCIDTTPPAPPVKCPEAAVLPPPPPPEPPKAQVMAFTKIEVTDKQILLKEAIHFVTGRSTILEDSFSILNEVVQALRDHPAIKIRVEGHTDSVGTPVKNQALSEARAGSVVQYLTSKGVDAARMTAEGFGASRPIAPNNTDKGRAKNRRVEIYITGQ